MKRIIYILSVVFFLWSVVFAAAPMKSSNTMTLYNYDSLLENGEMSEGDFDDDDDVERKRRHRR